jgi:ketosteroid isomerase-like protein
LRCANGETDPTGERLVRQKGVAVTSSTDQNKAVVRRFMTEILQGGDFAAIDEVLAPNYVNTAMGGTDLAGFKAMLPAMGAVISSMSFNITDLVAEGDAVVARFTSEMTFANGKKIESRGLTYYTLDSGKIVIDDPIESPDPLQELAALMPAPPSA